MAEPEQHLRPWNNVLQGDGNIPALLVAAGFDQMTPAAFDDFLSIDANGCYGSRWKGPYIARVAADPWGNKYVVNADAFSTTNPVWILSAGPDGAMDTGVASTVVQNDDIGVRLK